MPRYTMDIDEQFGSLLSELSRGTTKSEVIRRAVASHAFLKRNTAHNDTKVSITDQEDRVLKDVVLP